MYIKLSQISYKPSFSTSSADRFAVFPNPNPRTHNLKIPFRIVTKNRIEDVHSHGIQVCLCYTHSVVDLCPHAQSKQILCSIAIRVANQVGINRKCKECRKSGATSRAHMEWFTRKTRDKETAARSRTVVQLPWFSWIRLCDREPSL